MPKKKAIDKTESVQLRDAILKAMTDKKAYAPVVLDFDTLNNTVCDAFIICHGTSRTQVDAIADSVVRETRKLTGIHPWHKEGFENAEWILLDYGEIVVHIFQESRRKFYNLEELWGDAKITRLES